MQKILIIIILVLLFFLSVFALLKIGPKLIPDLGSVVETGGVSCVKFRDSRKNYVWGEVEVRFDNQLSLVEANKVLNEGGVALFDDDVSRFSTESAVLVDAPRGGEQETVNKLKGKAGIVDVRLKHCE